MEEMAPSTAAPCWSKIVTSAPPQETQKPQRPIDQVFVESCKSSKGIAVAIVDANAVIQGGQNLVHSADKFVTVPEVLAEIRDPVSRHFLEFLSFSIDSMDPSPDALQKVIKFARATGDLQTLSDVDLKLIALTYTLEAGIHGTKHLREAPPPVHVVNVKRLPEKELPGWGSNVPNLEEWEALECEVEDGSKQESRILPLKDINMNMFPDDQSVDGSMEIKTEASLEDKEDFEHVSRKPEKYPPKKSEVNIEGKKMVADGIDASKGQFDDDAGDWRPAVSRSTHRRYLRRKSRREYYEALSEKDVQHDLEEDKDGNAHAENDRLDQSLHQDSEGEHGGNVISRESATTEDKNSGENLSSILKQMRLEEDPIVESPLEMHATNDSTISKATDNNAEVTFEGEDIDMVRERLDHLEISSQVHESVDASYADDVSSEQSWMLRPLSESSVACITGDFAMQNVLLQMGLRLLAPGGMQIRELHRWILKCHACYTVTAEIGRIFCPKCGNGGTLRKVAVTVGENGVVLADRRPRIKLRGTKFSLPLPKGGRDAISKNVVLREDQLPQRFLNPSKKANKKGDDFFIPDAIFTHHTDKKAPHRPPVRQALAVFSGKRNPNDNHYSRSKRK
ncbi:RNA-binding protein nob1 putative isoform 1 [Tripterygium wilfordii]|uniref:RNA-binding protein nob1 putative isoform 1 n=1 Tax=Tripterygium wilfordii TaxID=458696 RepID=A0A7J7C774_TRIWF|nr:RNA-binding protein NOB1 [Tripterygium wilfordii]KAF5729983.1 RNA-binding protein nob1 putative isoform 1 [Tripterygium wilfordii]